MTKKISLWILLMVLQAVVAQAMPFSTDRSVGTTTCNVGVTPMGGATCTIPITVPIGVGNVSPNVAIAYNSQSGYGIVGYGWHLTGFSCITRAYKEVFHDGTNKGVSHTPDDAYCLDGRRLIHQLGAEGQEGGVYVVEGDPYTKVYFHGSLHTTWIEVRTPDGIVYTYGRGDGAKQYFMEGNYQRKIHAWYVDSMEDALGNYMTYGYQQSDLTVYPTVIRYGKNKNIGSTLENTVEFAYETTTQPNTAPFRVAGASGAIGMRLHSVTSRTNGTCYRSYLCEYDTVSDGAQVRYPRLVRVTESNGKGELLNPFVINWQHLPRANITASEPSIDIDYKDFFQEIDDGGQSFVCTDINGDGYSDIVKIASVKDDVTMSGGNYSYTLRTYAYVFLSEKAKPYGNVTYNYAYSYNLGSPVGIDSYRSGIMGCHAMDIDGDGCGEIILPILSSDKSMGYKHVNLTFLYKGHGITYWHENLVASYEMPLYVAFDMERNGKDDLLYMENAPADGKFHGGIIRSKEGMTLEKVELALSLPQKPQRLFVGDFNNDGLADLIFLYNGGYVIYYNQGGTSLASIYSDDAKTVGQDLSNQLQMAQGDFNGDGLVDFVYTDGNWGYYFALNNGKGGFDVRMAGSFDAADKNTPDDDGRFALVPFDMDHDGKTDLLIVKTDYEYHGGLHNHYSFRHTKAIWLRSDGNGLSIAHEVATNRENDGLPSNFLLGTFTSDGRTTLMAYGSNYHDPSPSDAVKMRLYLNSGYDVSTGKVTSVIDGMERKQSIQYSTLLDSTIYQPSHDAKYPVVDLKVGVPVVASIFPVNGASMPQRTTYHYKGLKAHVLGRGLLGFEETEWECRNQREKVVCKVTDWNPQFYIPDKTVTTHHLGGDVQYTYADNLNAPLCGTYFSIPAHTRFVDEYGHETVTENTFDLSMGRQTSQLVSYDDGSSYKRTTFSNFVRKGGQYLPTVQTLVQKHEDAAEEYTETTERHYTDHGLVSEETALAGTPLAITTRYAHDGYGNVVSVTPEGYQMPRVTKHNVYDGQGRFIERTYQEPDGKILAYEYDLWGNVLEERDETPTTPIVARYSYDGWDNPTEIIEPNAPYRSIKRKWLPNGVAKRYCIEESGPAIPTTRTLYDCRGRVVGIETYDMLGTAKVETRRLNPWGDLRDSQCEVGDHLFLRQRQVDDRGRVTAETLPTGRGYTCSYGDRSVSVTENGRTTTKTFDSWGNVKAVVGPGGTMSYTYASNGLPTAITANGETTYLSYDAAGHRTSIREANIGEVKCSYSADGRLLSKTDARGVTTSHKYDALGRLVSTNTGGVETLYTYSASGNDKGMLVRAQRGDLTEEYQYGLGTLVAKTRMDGENRYTTEYWRNAWLQPGTTIYPNDLYVNHVHDEHGYYIGDEVEEDTLWQVSRYDGLCQTIRARHGIVESTSRENTGPVIGKSAKRTGEVLYDLSYTREGHTANVLARSGMIDAQENFSYDSNDRLTEVRHDGKESMLVSYAENGNILSKTGVGEYFYGDRPHAVIGVDNVGGEVPGSTLSTMFDEFGKIQRIEDDSTHYAMTFTYGPDGQRWKSTLLRDGEVVRSTFYFDDYERITENGTTREFYHIGGHTLAIRESEEDDPIFYYVGRDHLGSVICIVDESGDKVFDASYDAWGKQTVNIDAIGYRHGYCGHEMLNEFGLINMNGRLYDPVLGRFLSADDYVQLPDEAQSYNRYSYCLNNPLKYTDPTGEYIGWDDLLAMAVGGTVNLTVNLIDGNVKNVWHGASLFVLGALAGEATLYGQPELAAIAVGAGNSILNQGFNNGFNHIDWSNVGMAGTMSLATSYLGGQLGVYLDKPINTITSGISNSLLKNVVNGALANSATGFILGTGMYLVNGQNVGQALRGGAYDAGMGALTGSLSGLTTGFGERQQARKQGILDTKVQADPVQKIVEETVHDPNLSHEGGTNSVYVGKDNNDVTHYVGITEREPELRFNEHLRSATPRANLKYDVIKETGKLSRIDARIIEQKLINIYQLENLYNKINSISPKYWTKYGIINN